MSRFFAGPDSASESESTESDQEERERKQKKDTDRFTSIFAASDSEDEGRRVVRSARDKRFEELQAVVKTLRNHRNIKDIGKVVTDYDNLLRAHQKARNIIDKQGTPGFYIRALAELEDFCNERWTNKQDISNKSTVKDLQTLRNQVRRYNKTYDDDIKAFREQPTAAKFEDMAEESTTDEDADNVDALEGGAATANRRPSKDEKPNQFLKTDKGTDTESPSGDTDEDEWSTDTDDDTGTSGTDDSEKLADVFRKKDEVSGKVKDMKAKDKRKHRRKDKHTRDRADDDGDDLPNKNKIRPQLFPGMKETDITHAKVLEKLTEIVAQRRRGGIGEQIELLEELRTVSQRHGLGPAIDVKVLFMMIGLIFDSARADGMRSEQWRRCTDTITEMLEILRQNPDIRTQEEVPDEDENVSDMSNPLIVRGSVLLVVERLDDEYLKILQNTDPHSPEYLQRLREEFKVENILTTAQQQYENRHSIAASERSRMYLRRIRHLYYRFDKSCLCRAVTRYPGGASDENVNPSQQPNGVVPNGTAADISNNKKERKTSKSSVEQSDLQDGDVQSPTATTEQQQPAVSTLNMMVELSGKVIQLCLNDRDLENMAIMAALHHAYFLAHHGYYFEAKDIFHSLELERRIDDPNTSEAAKVLYNRSVVRLGIAAFCHGLYSEAHELLMDIQSSGKVRELLGQGLVPARDFEKTPEQQYKERENQVPFHQQINLDILEAVYLLSAMLLEMPYLTAHEKDHRRRQISRNFHYHLRQYERHTIVGPPDSLAEHIIVASKHMRQGEWRECWQLVTADRLTRRAWKYIFNWKVLEAYYEQKVKEASLKCFMFTTAPLYAQLAMPLLEKKFDLTKEQVMAVLTYLIMKEELPCRIDVGSDSITIMRANADGLHQVARQVAERGLKMLENNEEMLKAPQGGMGMRGQHQGGDRYRGGYGGGGGYRGGYRGGRGGGGRYNDRDGDRDRRDGGDRHYGGGGGGGDRHYGGGGGGGDRHYGGGGDRDHYGGGQRSYQQRTQRA